MIREPSWAEHYVYMYNGRTDARVRRASRVMGIAHVARSC